MGIQKQNVSNQYYRLLTTYMCRRLSATTSKICLVQLRPNYSHLEKERSNFFTTFNDIALKRPLTPISCKQTVVFFNLIFTHFTAAEPVIIVA